MPKKQIDITDKIIGIYVEKYYGEKLCDIQGRYHVKCHSAIYFYCSVVEDRLRFNKELREKIEIKKNEYKSKIRINRERRENSFRS
ncbi:hypothetical protein CHRY9293_02895 [Chryseobacterium potabilaquae]|nr:hypothetical protein CHRY9293_02895 [Chryseobacterium potabilaquae]